MCFILSWTDFKCQFVLQKATLSCSAGRRKCLWSCRELRLEMTTLNFKLRFYIWASEQMNPVERKPTDDSSHHWFIYHCLFGCTVHKNVQCCQRTKLFFTHCFYQTQCKLFYNNTHRQQYEACFKQLKPTIFIIILMMKNCQNNESVRIFVHQLSHKGVLQLLFKCVFKATIVQFWLGLKI